MPEINEPVAQIEEKEKIAPRPTAYSGVHAAALQAAALQARNRRTRGEVQHYPWQVYATEYMSPVFSAGGAAAPAGGRAGVRTEAGALGGMGPADGADRGSAPGADL